MNQTSKRGISRLLSAGLVDQGCASLATFVVGVYGVGLGNSEAGAWALFFAAFRITTVVPTWLLYIPAEVRSLPLERRQRIGLLRQSLPLALPPALLAAPLIAVAWLFAELFGSGEVSRSTLLAFTVTGTLAAVVSPIQDHVRRVLHLSDLSWRAATVSLVQLVTIVAVVLLLERGELARVWIPFGALALANAMSLSMGLVLSWGRHAATSLRFGLRDLFRSSRWLLTQELTITGGDFLVAGAIYVFASPIAAGYAEAARQVARPLAVFSAGLRAVLMPRSMESASTRDPERARAIFHTFFRLLALAGVAYLLVAAVDWPLNPLSYVPQLSGAYVLGGLVALTLIADVGHSLMEPRKAELIGGGRQEQMARIERRALGARLAVVCTSAFTTAYAMPLSRLAMSATRWFGYSKELDRLYAPPSEPSSSAEETGPGSKPLPDTLT